MGVEGPHLVPELELKMSPFSILGKLPAEMGEFQAPSLPMPPSRSSGVTEMVIFSDHLCLCPNTLCSLQAGTSLLKLL